MGRDARRFLGAVILGFWIFSFFLPAQNVLTPGGFKTYKGWEEAIGSLFLAFIPYYGQLWIGNIFMIASPFYLKRLESGKGRAYALWFVFFSMLPLAFPFFPQSGFMENHKKIEVGFYVWVGTLLAMSVLCLSIALTYNSLEAKPSDDLARKEDNPGAACER
jgi:hypothetical protein